MRVWSSSRARWAPAFGDEAGNSSPGRLLARPSVVILELVDRAFQKLPAMIAGQRPCAKVPISHRRKSHSWLELPVTKPQLRGGAVSAAGCQKAANIHESRFSRVGVTAQRRHELCGPRAIPRDRRFASAPRGNNALCPSSPLCAGLLRHFSAIWRSKSNHGVVAAPVEVPGDAGQGGPRCIERPKPSRPRVCAKG